MNNRIEYIDTARGIAMLLVILSHSVTMTLPYLNRVILSFHMPLFFFISGMLARPIKGTWGGYLKKMFAALFVPQIILSLLRLLEDVLKILTTTKDFSDIQWIHWDWFLPVLFFCSFVYSCFSVFLKRNVLKYDIWMLIISMLLICPAQILNQYEFSFAASIINSRHIAVFPMAFLFYVMGNVLFLYREKLSSLMLKVGSSEFRGLVFLLAFILIVAIAFINEPVYMYKNEYGYMVLFLITSILGICVILYVSKCLHPASLMSYIGRHSIGFYIWNFIVIHVYSSILFKVLKGVILDEVIVLLCFFIAMLTLYAIVRLTYRYLPSLYGKNRMKEGINSILL